MEQKFYVTKEQVSLKDTSVEIKNNELADALSSQKADIAKYLSETFSKIDLNDISVSSDGVVSVKNEDFAKSITEAIGREGFAPGNVICGLGC